MLCLQGIKSCFKKGIFCVCCAVSVELSAKVMGMQLRHSLCSSEFCRSCKTKHGQKVSSCALLSQSCWLVVQLPTGKGRQGSRQGFSEGFHLLLFSTCLPLDNCFALEISEEAGTTFITVCQTLIPPEIC